MSLAILLGTLFSNSNKQYLPLHTYPFPVKLLAGQAHVNEPNVLLHVAYSLQLCDPRTLHSFIS